MVFSERAVINFEHGIRFRADSLRSIGIYNRTQCWGVWTPRSGHVSSDDTASCISGLGHYHLVVSPFHPVAWPYLVRVHIEISDTPLALREVTQSLSNLKLDKRLKKIWTKDPSFEENVRAEFSDRKNISDGFNILHLDHSPTGYSHNSCTIIAEALSVRELLGPLKTTLDEEYPLTRGLGEKNQEAYEEARKFGEKLSSMMFCAQLAIGEELDKLTNDGIVYPRLANREFGLKPFSGFENLFNQEEMDRMKMQRYLESHPPAAAEVRWLYELPYHAVFGGGEDSPMQLEYDAQTKRLVAREPFRYPGGQEGRASFSINRNYLAVVNFDPSEHQFRVVPIPERTRTSGMVLVEIYYRARARGANIAGLTHGLVDEMIEVFHTSDYRVLSVLNKPLESSIRTECGQIRFLVVSPELMDQPDSERKKLKARLEALAINGERELPAVKSLDEDQRNQFTGPKILPIDLELSILCKEPAVSQVFISLNFSHVRKENLIELIEQTCQSCGLEAIIAESYTDTATEHVIKKINGCDAFLQILAEPPIDQERRRTWLDFEYGMACGRDLPRVRLVDVSSRAYQKWGEIVDIDRDRYCWPINLSLGDHDLKKQIEKAVMEIASKIGSDSIVTSWKLGT